jgi:hypothetical protein
LGKQAEIGAEEYFAAFLSEAIACLAAKGGAVWMRSDSNLKLASCVNLKSLPGENRFRDRHDRLLHTVFFQGQAKCVAPREDFGEEVGGNPTDLLLLLLPIKGKVGIVAMVEIFHRPEANVSAQRGYLRFLQQMCELAGESLALQREEKEPDIQEHKKTPWWKFWK